MNDSDLQKTVEILKVRWKNFLEKKTKEEEEKIKETSYLDLAKTKKELKFLIKARNIVTTSIEKISDRGFDIEYDDEILDALTKEVFEKIKPVETKDPIYIIRDNIHKGNYHSRDVYDMIAGRIKPKKGIEYHRCWEVLDNEYKNMNIDCNADSGDDFKKYEIDNLINNFQGLSLGDMI